MKMKRNLIYLICFIYASINLIAQVETKTEPEVKTEPVVNTEPEVKTESGNLDAKTEFLAKSPKESNEDQYFDFLTNNTNTEEGFIALQRITEKFFKKVNGKVDWQSAIEMYETYKDDFPSMKARFDAIIKILSAQAYDLVDINLGSGVNSAAQEYSPLPTADKTTLYFTGVGRDEDNDSEDVFVSTNVDGLWEPATKLPKIINSDNQESPQSISTDGNQLILFGSFKGSIGKGDLFYSERTDTPEKWTPVRPFPRPINSEFFDCDAKLSGDGKSMIFVSDRPGAIGGYHPYNTLYHSSLQGNTDIYVSVKNEDGTWGEAINLGSKINTKYAERKPFLHPDGKTLYFSSDGHPGIGRLDLFKSTRLNEDSWLEWSEPINLGKEINTVGDDRGAIVSTEGDLAYFAATDREPTYGGSDIFTMTLPEFAKPGKVAMINGIVKDNDSKFVEADIIWEDLDTGKKLGKLKSSPIDGKYFIVLPLGRNYGFYAEKKGYFPISKNLDLKKGKTTIKMTEDIVMYRIADLLGDDLEMTGSSDMMYDQFNIKGQKKITMNNLFFEYNKSNLLKSSFLELDRVIWLLKNYPVELVEIAGYTDSLGTPAYNLTLSEKRAKSVVDYFVKKGVSKEVLIGKGYGQLNPVASNETAEGQQKNRRVELKILKINKIKKDEQLKKEAEEIKIDEQNIKKGITPKSNDTPKKVEEPKKGKQKK
jgi:outer membrane protein OmpA-like peptidoglycan-associated protein